jgi:hypothetical protein
MIHGVFRNGKIQPLDAIPSNWRDGQELEIDARDETSDPEVVRRWLADLQSIDAQLTDEDDARLMASLAEQKRIAKELAKRAAGLIP